MTTAIRAAFNTKDVQTSLVETLRVALQKRYLTDGPAVNVELPPNRLDAPIERVMDRRSPVEAARLAGILSSRTEKWAISTIEILGSIQPGNGDVQQVRNKLIKREFPNGLSNTKVMPLERIDGYLRNFINPSGRGKEQDLAFITGYLSGMLVEVMSDLEVDAFLRKTLGTTLKSPDPQAQAPMMA